MAAIKVTGGTFSLPPRRPGNNRFETVQVGRCRLFSEDDAISTVEAVVDGVCTQVSKSSGLVVTARDGQSGLVEYVGTDPDRYTLPLMLDGFADREDQQPYLNSIMAMAGGPDNERPSLIAVTGSVPPQVNFAIHQNLWWVESVAPVADGTLYTSQLLASGKTVQRLLRQHLVLTLLKPDDAVFVQKPIEKAQKAAKGKKAAAPAYVTARSGDSLLTIAARTGKKWRDVADLNGIRDPSNVHAGQRIRVS